VAQPKVTFFENANVVRDMRAFAEAVSQHRWDDARIAAWHVGEPWDLKMGVLDLRALEDLANGIVRR